MNRVTSVTDHNGNTVKYGYDQLGNRISITYPGGEIVRYTYDGCGRMLTATDAAGKITRYAYDKNGRLIKQSRPDGTVETRTYDEAGQLIEQKDVASDGSLIHHITYTYDASGNIIEKSGSGDGGTSLSADVSMTYDKDNRLVTYNGEKVVYDKDGNMTHGPVDGQMADLTYDCRNRLIRVTAGDMTTEYRYDAENIRTAEVTKNTKSGGVYQKVYMTDREATYSQLLTETTRKKNLLGIYETSEVKTYTYGIGLLSEKSRSTTETLYYHFDNLGSTTELTNHAGEIIYRFAYDTYGKLTGVYYGNTNLLTTGSVSEVLNDTGIRFLYNGEFGVQTDTNTLYYMRARYYNPQIMRFINRDIVAGTPENSQSLNRYAYAQGNPVNRIDPFGLSPQNPYSNAGHAFLDFLGLFFDGADLLNAVWYFAEGDYANAALSAMALVPVIGLAAYGLKTGIKAGRALTKSSKLVKGAAQAMEAAWKGAAKYGKKAGSALKNFLKKAGMKGAAEGAAAGAAKATRTADKAADAAKATARTTAEVAESGAKAGSKGGAGSITYNELDSLGRTTGIEATITPDMIGTGSPAKSSIKPAGFGGQAQGHARGHLLGNQLGGSGSEPRNLMTIYQNPVNHPVMSSIEASVRKAVEGGQIVNYKVTPIYKGKNLIPRGITIQAQGSGGLNIYQTILNRK